MIPPNKPRTTTEELTALAKSQGHDLGAIRQKHPLLVVGVRGYYLDTQGKPGVNDRGMYDDALILVTDNAFASFNGNTDPSSYRKGRGKGAGKGMATLKPGLWPVYRFDLHRGKYLALCQRAGEVTVIRDGNPPYEDTGWFGMNLHEGGITGTSSEGCQTVPRQGAQWKGFIGLAEAEARRIWGAVWKQRTVAYLLLEKR